jgi:hypothetical protein
MIALPYRVGQMIRSVIERGPAADEESGLILLAGAGNRSGAQWRERRRPVSGRACRRGRIEPLLSDPNARQSR